jgi:hypothetical protein
VSFLFSIILLFYRLAKLFWQQLCVLNRLSVCIFRAEASIFYVYDGGLVIHCEAGLIDMCVIQGQLFMHYDPTHHFFCNMGVFEGFWIFCSVALSKGFKTFFQFLVLNYYCIFISIFDTMILCGTILADLWLPGFCGNDNMNLCQICAKRFLFWQKPYCRY